MEFRWIAFGVLIIVLLGGFYAFIVSQPREKIRSQASVASVEVPIVDRTNKTIYLDALYWGIKNNPAGGKELCTGGLQKNLTFTMEGNTPNKANLYSSCYVLVNGEQHNTSVVESYGNYLHLTSVADVSTENNIITCCILGSEIDCTQSTPLIRC